MNVKPSVIMADSVLRNTKKEPLHVIVQKFQGFKSIPTELRDVKTPEGLVFAGLANCFRKAGFVAEGLLPNIIWGFTECGHDAKRVAQGLTKLRSLDYIFYSTNQRSETVSETNYDPSKPIWIRYSTKMIDLFYQPEDKSAQGIILPSV